MHFFDRYADKIVSEKDLPDQIDFGRYCLVENGVFTRDVTYLNFATNKAIRLELLLDKNKSLQDIFIDIRIDVEKASQNSFNVIPLIRRIKNKLGLNDFEKLLDEEVFHLEEIFRHPHYMLTREIEKVHVSRAKRIPSRSYQYLASHTEDWYQKSIVSFKPSRILHEELILNLDIYENQLSVALVERCLVYLNGRLKQVQDLTSFLKEYQKLLKNKDLQNGWYNKIHRNLSLIGSVYDDEHYKGKDSDGSTLSETEKVLKKIKSRLLKLRKSELFESVNKRASQKISLRNSNVLANHKHYRYVSLLWKELEIVRPKKGETEKLKFEQNVINGVRSYAKCLIAYTLKDNMSYKLSGSYKTFTGDHTHLSPIHFTEKSNGTFELKIGDYNLKCIVIGNDPDLTEKLVDNLKKQHAFIFYFAERPLINDFRFININPLDPDSSERIGSLLRKYFLKIYCDNICRSYEFKHLLKNYVQLIPESFLEFDLNQFTYTFHSYPKFELLVNEIKNRIESSPVFRKKSRPVKEEILNSMSQLITEINTKAEELRHEFLKCFNCGVLLQSYKIDQLNYLKCEACGCLIEGVGSANIKQKIDDPRHLELSPEEFGMDHLTLIPSDL